MGYTKAGIICTDLSNYKVSLRIGKMGTLRPEKQAPLTPAKAGHITQALSRPEKQLPLTNASQRRSYNTSPLKASVKQVAKAKRKVSPHGNAALQ